ncbi:transmembrane amino acid transporter protein-domain-containing protein [Mortierella sp. GBAus27b]|nr:hypothetical protein BGX31_001661 [Mortierella sp. GBA43]KAI8354726.1 transmembrane amino acid transporter protein-domain-containing protein [Mortierella sp. GBAus27b]
MDEDVRSWIFRQGSDNTLVAAEPMMEVSGSSDVYKEGKECYESKAGYDSDKETGAVEAGSVGGSVEPPSDRGDGVSTYKAIASLICVIAGTGTLGMPHAVAQAGWVGTLIIVLALFMSLTTGSMLVKCLYLKSDTRRSSYQEIAQDAYGRVGHYIALAAVAVNLFGCAILYVILAGTLIEAMIRERENVHEPVYLYVIACSFFVWVCLVFTKSMKEVAILSIIGASATIGVVMITVGVSADMIRHGAEVTIRSTHQVVNWSKLPSSLATMSFAYGGNMVYPHIEQSMRYPRSWSKTLWSALVVCFVLYFTIAIAGYTAFGNETENPVLKNLSQGVWQVLANSLIILHVLLAAPIFLTSLSMMVEASITERYPSFAQGSASQQFLKRAIPRTIIVCTVGLIASVVPYFGDVMDLLGALATCLLVFVMPILFYYKLGGMEHGSLPSKIWAWFIFVIGLVALVMGTYDATKNLVDDIRK